MRFHIISAFLYLPHLLSLYKILIYLPFIYILYDECSDSKDIGVDMSEDISAKYTMIN